jgi:hypothetical protein
VMAVAYCAPSRFDRLFAKSYPSVPLGRPI